MPNLRGIISNLDYDEGIIVKSVDKNIIVYINANITSFALETIYKNRYDSSKIYCFYRINDVMEYLEKTLGKDYTFENY